MKKNKPSGKLPGGFWLFYDKIPIRQIIDKGMSYE
jgi:hypothetical protein